MGKWLTQHGDISQPVSCTGNDTSFPVQEEGKEEGKNGAKGNPLYD